MRLRILHILLLCVACCAMAGADNIAVPNDLPTEFPRLLTNGQTHSGVVKLIKKEAWAKETFSKLKAKTDVYLAKVEAQPDWLYSRLQMYWHSHATDVYINGESFDHVGGDKAPEPTVRFTGTRGTLSYYNRPSLDNVVPYDDDDQSRVTFINNQLPGSPMEKASPEKTGRNIETINNDVIGIARNAAFIYWVTGDERYARMAAKVFDVYMAGIYYRNVPIDMNNGQQQTLVGMASFEVIHEDVLNPLTEAYDFLHGYLQTNYKARMPIYSSAFKKWADCIIDHGVPQNNWNLFQAIFIFKVAQVLDNDSEYKDGKGRSYYIDYILNKNGIRQWSLAKLASYGFSTKTGVWAESPGYASNVVCDYADIAYDMAGRVGINLFNDIPVLRKAIDTMPQYLMPNMMIVGFGDTHPSYMRTSGIRRLIQMAQKYKNKADEAKYTAMLKCIDPSADVQTKKSNPPVAVSSFFADQPLVLNPKTKAANISQYVSPLFYADNVSWLVQRSGMDKQHSLAVSLNGSYGNHMHANGISMELYGKGWVLGPDAGIGKYLYSGLDYQEYYSQFPAHNTVCVDGISQYPVMKSNHAFTLVSSFPESTEASKDSKFVPATYSQISFREPETNSDQLRTTGIVTTGATGGYYVDIFRSKRHNGGDKIHDYFYHNLGQAMTLTASDGSDISLKPTEELSFAGGYLNAYSYIYDKHAANTSKDVKATFTINNPAASPEAGNAIVMTMWMRGDKNRKVFKALSPVNLEYERMRSEPYKIGKQPVLTFVARQKGEAWNHPFVAVYEPSTEKEPSEIASVSFFHPESSDKSAVGIIVTLKNGRKDYIFSSATGADMSYQGMTVKGYYAVVSDKFTLQNNQLINK